ncbi:hypothetical protein PC116_g34139 [Phytophthora cactorum]|nr:hypothetical protein PC116_g34139 [Phytophthora cactorum]
MSSTLTLTWSVRPEGKAGTDWSIHQPTSMTVYGK